MALVFHDGRFIPEAHIQKSTEASKALRLLRSFLDKNEPGLVRFLLNTWNSQGNAITYKELREAILNGDLDPKLLEEWMQDYSRFVVKYLHPQWEEAMIVANTALEAKYPAWYFNPMADGVRNWVDTHAAEFVTNVTTTQIEALRAVVQRAAVLEDMSVDELSRAIRPMIGLTKPQATANMNYYEKLRASGVSPKQAREKSIRYAARQHRQRAYTVARTELASAYNQGAYEGTKQAQAAGLIGAVVKVWCTADDERVCSICGSLEGVEVAMDDDFNGASRSWSTRRTAPAHPGCRCAIIYNEISAPEKIQGRQSKIQNLVV